MRPIRISILLTLALYQLLLVGCTVEPVKEDDAQLATPEQSLSRLYTLAKESHSPESEKYQLEAVRLLISLNRFSEAAGILSGLSTVKLPDKLNIQYTLLRAQLALRQYRAREALDILSANAGVDRTADHAIKKELATLRADAYRILHYPILSARELVSLSHSISDPKANAEQIWADLMLATTTQLSDALSNTENSVFNGWINLALLAKRYQNNLDRELAALSEWLKDRPDHPAAAQLPKELRLLNTIASQRPANITLMLPLNGKHGSVGRAIRDGFLAAYYDALGQRSQTPEITIVDTSSSIDFLSLYNRVTDSNTEMIIGPLQKENVRLLMSLGELQIPTLALNYDDSAIMISNLYQFGLSAEDEARQVARDVRRKGFINSLVMAPNSEWGNRIVLAFADEWQKQQGHLLETQYFSEENSYSNAIKSLLNIDESERRARRIQLLTRQPLEFTPQRRDDMDFIFMVATPKQARQIKPTLAFHFAGNIPVYATSHIYSGSASPLLDRDLDEIRFCETPWMLPYRYDDPIKQQINTVWQTESGHLGRLYALGVDSYHLFPRISLLAQLPNAALDGATGKLVLDENGQIVRELEWATIRRGKILKLNQP